MNVLRLSTAALLAAGAASHVWAQASPEPGGPADLILKNGAIYTVDAARSWARAVVVRDGRIVYVGDDAGSDAFAGSGTKVVDLEGKMVLPGFVDGHNHAYLMAESLFWLSLNPFATVEARQAAIRDRVTADPDLRQLRGVGWDDIEKDAAAAGVAPKDLLDAAAPDIPVVIIDNSHHNFWVNSAALALADIDASTADPAGGTIERDPKTGEPNGVLREFAAQNLVINALPQPDFTAEEYQETILTWQELAARYGITSAFVPVHYPTETLLQALEALDNSGRLTVRYDLALWADENEGTEQIGHLKALRDAYQGESYKVDSVKIFSDGIGEEKLVWDQSDLEQTVTALDKEGFRVYVHAIGNPTFFPSGNVLDAFEKALDANGRRDSRHAITHLDWVKPEDVARFRDMGVLAVPQAAWFGKPWYDGTTGDAKKNQQRFQSLEDAGVVERLPFDGHLRARHVPADRARGRNDAARPRHRDGGGARGDSAARGKGEPRGDDRELHDQRRLHDLRRARPRLDRAREESRSGGAGQEPLRASGDLGRRGQGAADLLRGRTGLRRLTPVRRTGRRTRSQLRETCPVRFCRKAVI